MTDQNNEELDLIGEFDAMEWAEAFQRIVVDGGLTIDTGLMLGWFANAIMAGYDRGRMDESNRRETDEAEAIIRRRITPFSFSYSTPDGSLSDNPYEGELDLPGAVFQALGYASTCWTESPTGIFESDRCKEAGDALLAFIEDRS